MRLDRIIAVRTSKTVYKDGDLAIKVFDSSYSKADILHEALQQTRMEEAGINVPSVRGIEQIDGKWAIISELISGKTLFRLMQENPNEDDNHIKILASVHSELTKKEAPLIIRLNDRLIRKIQAVNLSNPIKKELFSILNKKEQTFNVCHGDLTPSNIIISKDGTPYILDWSHSTSGNPASDAAISYLLLSIRHGKDIAEKYLDLFCNFRQIDKEEIESWMPLMAAAQLQKCRPCERAELKAQVDKSFKI